MTRPPFPTNKSATCSSRLEQNVICLAPAVNGAVLLPVILFGIDGWQVKIVLFTHCTFSCTEVFTLGLHITRKIHGIAARILESSLGKTTRTGGSDPTLWASIRPKSF